MFNKNKGLLPPYFKEKFTGVDELQVKLLPAEIRESLIHGTNTEAAAALKDIRTRELLQGKELLGQAAHELLRDMRTMSEQEK